MMSLKILKRDGENVTFNPQKNLQYVLNDQQKV